MSVIVLHRIGITTTFNRFLLFIMKLGFRCQLCSCLEVGFLKMYIILQVGQTFQTGFYTLFRLEGMVKFENQEE